MYSLKLQVSWMSSMNLEWEQEVLSLTNKEPSPFTNQLSYTIYNMFMLQGMAPASPSPQKGMQLSLLLLLLFFLFPFKSIYYPISMCIEWIASLNLTSSLKVLVYSHDNLYNVIIQISLRPFFGVNYISLTISVLD